MFFSGMDCDIVGAYNLIIMTRLEFLSAEFIL